jgi:hypothetical protein
MSVKKAKDWTKDWTKLESYAGMSWKKAEETLPGNFHMLALGKDRVDVKAGMEISQTWKDTGKEAGMAVFLAHLVLRKNGSKILGGVAIALYQEVAEALSKDPKLTAAGRKKVETLKYRIRSMEEWAAWAAVYANNKGFKWPIEPPFLEDVQKKAGLANVMLFIAARELDNESGTGLVASVHMAKFLQEGMEEYERQAEERGEGGAVGEGAQGVAARPA